jgi:hypothetical protein
MLIPEVARDGLVRQLQARVEEVERQSGPIHHIHPPRSYVTLIQNAPTIPLPGLVLVTDAEGDTHLICAWTEDQALAIAAQKSWIQGPCSVQGCAGAPIPGTHLMNLGGFGDPGPGPDDWIEQIEAEYAAELTAEAQADQAQYRPPPDDNIPF